MNCGSEDQECGSEILPLSTVGKRVDHISLKASVMAVVVVMIHIYHLFVGQSKVNLIIMQEQSFALLILE